MTAVEILLDVERRIGNRERWCRGQYAEDAKGNPCDPHVPEAVRWCVVGAAWAAEGRAITKSTAEALQLLNKAAGKRSAHEINDRESHARVMALVRTAIEIA